MADRAGAPAAAAPIAICVVVTLIAVSCVVIVVPSLISTYTPTRTPEVYGAEYQCDSIMLKFFYENSTYRFSNGVVGNSSSLSTAASMQLYSLGLKNLAGCLLYNGRAWDAANMSQNSRRRRRQSQLVQAGMYYIGTAAIYRTVRCPKKGDLNKGVTSSKLSRCSSKAIGEANSLVNGTTGTTFIRWPLTNRVLLEVSDVFGAFQLIAVDAIFGVPGNLALAISNNLPGVTAANQIGFVNLCRFSRILTQAQIATILASQMSSNNFDSSTVLSI